jgi:DNA-binding SARP family transcriptional activator
MAEITATLFGKFNIQQGDRELEGMDQRKVQELLSYLLLFRTHPHSRDFLCETFWSDQSAASSRKNLRQTLWRLQSAMQRGTPSTGVVLQHDNDWIQIHLAGNFWLDIEEFEKIFNLIKGKKASELSGQEFDLLEHAAKLYTGDLLEGWYSDWCIFERERFQTMHLLMLDKLAQYCEIHAKYEEGLAYGMEILRYDYSYERAHRQLMRLYSLTGNRTQALHQFKHCEMALRKELDIEPSEATKLLYEQIRSDSFSDQPVLEESPAGKNEVKVSMTLTAILGYLKEVTDSLARLEHQMNEEISPSSG